MFEDDVENNPNAQAIKELCDIGAGKKPAAEATIAGQQELTNEQRRRLPYIIALYHKPCYLCYAEPPCHYFLPWKTAADAVAPWRITAICQACRALPDVFERIEARLKDELENEPW